MPEPINLKIVAAISMLKLAQNGGVTDTDEGRKIEEQLQFRLDQESDKENIFVPSENEVHEEWIRGQRAARAKLKGNRPKKEFSEDEKRAYQNISTLMSRRCKNEEKRVKEVLFNLIEVGTADNEQGSELAGLLRLDYQAAASTTNAAVLKKRRDDKKKTAVAARKEATMFKASSDITNTENMRKLEELEAIADELEGKTDAGWKKNKKKTAVAAKEEATNFKSSNDMTNTENMRKLEELEAIADELESKTYTGWYKNKKKTAVAAKEEATNFKSSNDMTNTENMRKLEELEAIADELESKTYTGWYKNKKKTAVAAREEVFDSIERATNIDELKGDEAFLQLKSDAVQSYTRLRGTADQVGPAHTKFGLYLDSAVFAKTIKVETGKSDPRARSTVELFNNCIMKSQTPSYSDFWKV